MKKKRLMILIWNMGIGGMQKRIRDVILDIAENRQDWEVHLVVKFQKPSYFTEEIEKKTKAKIYYYSPSHQKSNSLPSVFWIARRYINIRPDVCLTFLEHLSIIALLLRIAVFWHKCKIVLNEGVFLTTYLQIYRKKRWKLWRLGMKLFYPMADKIIVPTHACFTDLVKNYNVPAVNIKIIPNWTLFSPVNKKAHDAETYDLIYVGRLEKEKNISVLLPIMQGLKIIYPRIRLCLVGEGSLEGDLRQQAKILSIRENIIFVGYQGDVKKFLVKSKVYIHPSNNEGLPNTVLEAAMCQLPTVANNFIGVNEVIVDGETGIVSETSKAMLKAVKVLLEDKKARRLMGSKAQDFVATNFSMNNQKRFIEEMLFD